MDMQWCPPANDESECNHLEANFLTCLKQKSLKDDVSEMRCNVEQIGWFNLDCPERFKEYKDPLKLRNIFLQVKNGKSIDRPAFVRL